MLLVILALLGSTHAEMACSALVKADRMKCWMLPQSECEAMAECEYVDMGAVDCEASNLQGQPRRICEAASTMCVWTQDGGGVRNCTVPQCGLNLNGKEQKRNFECEVSSFCEWDKASRTCRTPVGECVGATKEDREGCWDVLKRNCNNSTNDCVWVGETSMVPCSNNTNKMTCEGGMNMCQWDKPDGPCIDYTCALDDLGLEVREQYDCLSSAKRQEKCRWEQSTKTCWNADDPSAPENSTTTAPPPLLPSRNTDPICAPKVIGDMWDCMDLNATDCGGNSACNWRANVPCDPLDKTACGNEMMCVWQKANQKCVEIRCSTRTNGKPMTSKNVCNSQAPCMWYRQSPDNKTCVNKIDVDCSTLKRAWCLRIGTDYCIYDKETDVLNPACVDANA